MCGIVGAVARRDVVPNLVDGLKRLEYRGYDSCGVVVYRDRKLERARSVARVAELQQEIAALALSGSTGIAHTRWATHGAPVTANAHPHFSPGDGNARIALSHNGIIENADELRKRLEAHGYVFASQTDSDATDRTDHGDDDDARRAVRRTAHRARSRRRCEVAPTSRRCDRRLPDRLSDARLLRRWHF